MPLISDLLEDLDKALWFCSLDMVSGFWVVSMTDRARQISAFVTPFGLFEWNRMSFVLKNAPQIYQRLIDNALYGYLKVKDGADELTNVFTVAEPDQTPGPSVLQRRSYIDDILIPAPTWTTLCGKVQHLLEKCGQWNLSISVAKLYWGRSEVPYLGHHVSSRVLETNPQNWDDLIDLPFPGTLRAMQSFLGSLNYYRRFIEDLAIYAAVLYELREMDYQELKSRSLSKENTDQEGDRLIRAK